MDCLDEILNHHEKMKSLNSKTTRNWINSVLIDLMQELEEETPNFKKFLKVRNCLILLINLFFDIDYPDHFHKKGKSILELSNEERTKCINVLKLEFSDYN